MKPSEKTQSLMELREFVINPIKSRLKFEVFMKTVIGDIWTKRNKDSSLSISG
jgi:hypothetical protein